MSGSVVARAVLHPRQLQSQLEVINMTQLNLSNSNLNCTDSTRHILSGRWPWLAAVVGLLIGCAIAVGCSKEKSKPASSEVQTSTNQAVLNQPATPPSISSPAATPAPAPKKVVKKRAATVTYKDQASGISFRYPRKYALKNGDDADSDLVPMDFVQPGGATTVSVALPKGLYPKTDLASALFLVNVNKGLTEAECGQFALPQSTTADKPVQPSKLALGPLELQEVENISGEEAKQSDTKYYHLFQNGACYEFALTVSTESAGDDETISPVDREKVFRRLETILATVKIKPQPDTQVATGSVATSAEPQEASKQ